MAASPALGFAGGKIRTRDRLFLFLRTKEFWVKDLDQFFKTHQPHAIKLEGLTLAFSRLATCPQHQKQRDNQGAVHLDCHVVLGLPQPVTAPKNTLDLFKKELDLPEATIDRPHKLSC